MELNYFLLSKSDLSFNVIWLFNEYPIFTNDHSKLHFFDNERARATNGHKFILLLLVCVRKWFHSNNFCVSICWKFIFHTIYLNYYIERNLHNSKYTIYIKILSRQTCESWMLSIFIPGEKCIVIDWDEWQKFKIHCVVCCRIAWE